MPRTPLLLATLAVLPLGQAAAQAPARPVTFGVSGGAAGADAGRGVGSHVGASAAVALPRTPLALRADAALTAWSRGGGTSRVTSATASLVLPLRSAGLAPYAVAGAGGYASSAGGGLGAGVSAGLGVDGRVGGMRAFAEVRAHQYRVRGGGARRMVPLTVGVRF